MDTVIPCDSFGNWSETMTLDSGHCFSHMTPSKILEPTLMKGNVIKWLSVLLKTPERYQNMTDNVNNKTPEVVRKFLGENNIR